MDVYDYALSLHSTPQRQQKWKVIEDSESEEMDEQGFDQSADTPNVDLSRGQY